jgi:pullulanase
MDYFDQIFAYDGNDLGVTYNKEKTTFKVWAPTAKQVALNLYDGGEKNVPIETLDLEKGIKGTWHITVNGDLNGVYYTYLITIGNDTNETVDIYAKAVGVNGNKGMVVDLEATNPEGFENDKRPPFSNPTDAVIYELHIRDISVDKSSGIINKGKFLGLQRKELQTHQDFLQD